MNRVFRQKLIYLLFEVLFEVTNSHTYELFFPIYTLTYLSLPCLQKNLSFVADLWYHFEILIPQIKVVK